MQEEVVVREGRLGIGDAAVVTWGGGDASQGSSRQRERPGTQNRQWGLCQPSQVAQEHVLLAKPCFFWLLSSASNREGHGWAKGTTLRPPHPHGGQAGG